MDKLDYSSLNGRQLDLFLAVYETNSIGRAAEQLGLNQSTVSYGIERLREQLGDPLFVKSGRGITPTERADALAPVIRSITSSMEALCATREFDPASDAGPLTIATNVMEWLPECANALRQISHEAPGATVRFLELGSRDNIRELLTTSVADVIISIRPLDLAGSLSAEPLLSSQLVCYFDRSCRNPVRDILDFATSGHATLDFGGRSKSTIDAILEDLELQRTVKLRAPNPFALAYLMLALIWIWLALSVAGIV